MQSDAAVQKLGWHFGLNRDAFEWHKCDAPPNSRQQDGVWVQIKNTANLCESDQVMAQNVLHRVESHIWQTNTIDGKQIYNKTDKIEVLAKNEEHNLLCFNRLPQTQYCTTDDAYWIELTEPYGHKNIEDKVFRAFTDEQNKTIYQAQTPKDDDKYRHSFNDSDAIDVFQSHASSNALQLSHYPDEQCDCLLLRPNTYGLSRQLNAIKQLQNKPQPHHRPLLKLFESHDHAKWEQSRYLSALENTAFQWHVLKPQSPEETLRPGTQSQRTFVAQALHTPDFAVLEGPPGSGKTTAICELILQLMAQNKRVLLCASTHVAVDNVLEGLFEDGKHKDKVIAVRIGDRNNISESVREYQYEKIKNTYKTRLKDFLTKQTKLQPAQKLLLDALNANKSDTIERIILDSANLVCGTTIGILQHPDIKSRNREIEPFDMLIIDEASKTTFPEFLVPAMLAKRWILVGDPKQLSPYVDDEEIAVNVDNCVKNKAIAKVCLDVFKSKQDFRGQNGAQIIITEDAAIPPMYVKQAQQFQNEMLCIQGKIILD